MAHRHQECFLTVKRMRNYNSLKGKLLGVSESKIDKHPSDINVPALVKG